MTGNCIEWRPGYPLADTVRRLRLAGNAVDMYALLHEMQSQINRLCFHIASSLNDRHGAGHQTMLMHAPILLQLNDIAQSLFDTIMSHMHFL